MRCSRPTFAIDCRVESTGRRVPPTHRYDGLGTAALVLALLLAAPCLAGSQAFKRPRVVDEAGTTIGTVTGTLGGGSPVVILRKVNRYAVQLLAQTDVLLGSAGDNGFMHETADCSGTRFVRAYDSNNLVRDSIRFDPSGTGTGPFEYYFAGDPIEPRTVRSFEWSATPDTCRPLVATRLANGLCCFGAKTILFGGPAAVAIDGSKLKPPFGIR